MTTEANPGQITIGGDLRVYRIGYGAMKLTGDQVWGPYPDHDHAIRVLRGVVEAGINLIDTADVYGPHDNELLIKEALHPYPGDLVIATKGGFVRGGYDYSTLDAVGNPNYLRQSAHMSARRLGVAALDLYYLHSGRALDAPFEDQVGVLAELRQAGLIRHVGLSNITLEQLRVAQSIVPVAAVTALYNVTARAGGDLLAAAEADQIVFSPWHPVTTTDGPLASRAAEVLPPIAAAHGASVQQVALAWQLQGSPQTLPIPGTTSLAHLQENLKAASIVLSPQELQAIDDITAPADPRSLCKGTREAVTWCGHTMVIQAPSSVRLREVVGIWMAVGYRSIFSLRHDQDAVRLTAEQFRSWLVLKGYGLVAVVPGVHELAGHAQLVVTELDAHDGSRSLRYRLTETSSTGEWVTTVTVHHDGREDDWVWVDVNAPPSTPGPAVPQERLAKDVDAADAWWTGVPHMVRVILSAADAHDGEMILSARPALVTEADVDGLISAVCDPGRRGTALVAAPIPDVPAPRMIDHVERLTRECVGLAGIYVLDNAAAAKLEESFAPSHSVPLGAVRTFLPEVDPASAVDARRHRVLLARTIAEQPPGKLAHLLGRANRSRALNLPLPSNVAQVDRLLSREEPATVLRAIQATPPGPFARRSGDGAAGLAPAGLAGTTAVREVAIAGELLTSLVSEFQSDVPGGPDEMTARFRELLAEGRGVLRGHREISRRLATLQDMLEDVEDDRDLARARLEDEQLDHAETQAELLKAKLELDRLRGILSRVGRVDQTRAATAAAQSPGSFAELLERLDEHVLSCVIFTGDPKNTLELDDFDPLGTWAAKSWDVLRVLDGYAAARRRGEFSKGLHAYLGHTPPGRPGYPPGAHSTQESEPVERSPKLRKLRVFPVPQDIHPDGAIFMDAHFKIARKGLISPRIYYHDASQAGKIYVGYIGKHLPNTHTN